MTYKTYNSQPNTRIFVRQLGGAAILRLYSLPKTALHHTKKFSVGGGILAWVTLLKIQKGSDFKRLHGKNVKRKTQKQILLQRRQRRD